VLGPDHLLTPYGIPEYWIVDVQAKHIELYRQPGPGGYTQRTELGPTDVASPQALPDVRLSVGDVLG
jgi:Uma2 family endonuclease